MELVETITGKRSIRSFESYEVPKKSGAAIYAESSNMSLRILRIWFFRPYL